MRAYDPVIAVKVKPNQLTDKCTTNKAEFPNFEALNEVCNHLSGKYADIPYTPEEDAEFARIERNQDIALLANVIRTSPTTSAEAIAARVLDAGYQFSGSAVRLK
ncbi:hypothetical protein [Shewanella xiamenensis]|uniref:hypothetical protein n=1 Tax=Shewanella xiamenensis TaxID=332186 RepID=UPI00217CD9BE|nr:hypothetical protein [Shewanella xiamenensis]MCT8871575.1 hypothetical protein [Shewanella xiamenensis]UWH43586.1 hypothetical protein KXJ80_10280 [Shewanella xiamenensis]